MTKVDLKAQLKHLYQPSATSVGVVDVPAMMVLAIDGRGDPNTAPAYKQAVEALFAVSYALKFLLKNGPRAIDYAVMPLEGLWWTADGAPFSPDYKEGLCWTAMIVQPDGVTPAFVEEARRRVAAKKGEAALADLRYASWHEGLVAQIMHVGRYDDEGPALAKIHAFIAQHGHTPQGKHHEIYLGDPARTAPERLRTILRQPIA